MSITNTLSVIIITFNEASKIAACLESVSFADEIIVVDSGSTDSTIDICRNYTENVFTNTPWPGFGEQKQIALKFATKHWVLSIDADERVSPDLKTQILETINNPNIEFAYKISRKSSFCGKFMQFSGWSPDYVLRLFLRKEANFSNDYVHERVILNSSTVKIGVLNAPLIHYPIDNLQQAAKKMHSYAELGAKNKWKNSKSSNLIIAALRANWTFIRTFILQLGFLDGYRGLQLALYNSHGTYRKYALLQQYNTHCKVMSCALVITTYNWPKALKEVLLSVQKQTKIPDEIIIADDGSTIETTQLIHDFMQKTDLPIKHIFQADNGFRAAKIRNKAIASSNSDYIIFIDGDCILQNDFVAKHCLLARPGYFTDGNRIVLSQDQSEQILQKQNSLFSILSIKQKIKLLNLPIGWLRKLRPSRWKGVKTCNVGIYRNDLLRINGFNEDFTGWGFEDSDLVIRLYNSGVKRISARAATSVIHLWHKTNFDEAKANINRTQLALTMAQKSTWVKPGLDQYINK